MHVQLLFNLPNRGDADSGDEEYGDVCVHVLTTMADSILEILNPTWKRETLHPKP